MKLSDRLRHLWVVTKVVYLYESPRWYEWRRDRYDLPRNRLERSIFRIAFTIHALADHLDPPN